MPDAAPTLAVVMDYQNVHLTARDLFAPYGTLAHERALRQRDERQRRAVLTDVFVYRGQPGNREQPTLYGITQANGPSGGVTGGCT